MQILVCVKQVIDPEGIRLDLDPDGNVKPVFTGEERMNRYDACALETALRIKESMQGVEVHALTFGPERCQPVLIRSMGMGADKGVLMRTEDFTAPGEVGPAADFIATFLNDHPYDLILTGAMSEDRMRGETGPRLAALMGLPFLGSIVNLEVDENANTLSADREIEGGVREGFEVRLPAIIAVQTGIHEPRYPALSRLIRGKSRGVEIVEVLNPAGKKARARQPNLAAPMRRRKTEFIEGDATEKARQLLDILRKRGVLQ
jgi:electron transfer flavoprotein beta subunit